MSIPAIAAMSTAAMFATSLAVTAVTTGVSYMAQKATADAQLEAQNQNVKATRDAAVTSMAQQGGDLQQREMQETASTALTVQNAKIKAKQAASTASATSESAGLSVDALMADYDRQYSSFADSQMQQLGFNVEQIDRTRQGIEAQAQGRINTVPRAPIQSPSLGLALMEFGAGALNTYDSYSVVDPLTNKRTLT